MDIFETSDQGRSIIHSAVQSTEIRLSLFNDALRFIEISTPPYIDIKEIIFFFKVNWRPVIWGLILQFAFGLFTIRWAVGRSIFQCLSTKVATFLNFAQTGAKFVFSDELVDKGVFAFSVSLFYVAIRNKLL